MKKIIFLTIILLATITFSGCGKEKTKEEVKTINPLSPSSMVDTYEDSKEKINDSVQKENDKINKAFEESGLR